MQKDKGLIEELFLLGYIVVLTYKANRYFGNTCRLHLRVSLKRRLTFNDSPCLALSVPHIVQTDGFCSP